MKKITRFLFCTFVAIMLMGTAISATACHQKEEYSSVPEVNEPQPTGEIIPTVDRQKELKDARKKYSDAVAWLYMPGAEVDDPVVQAKDNAYCLQKDENGNYSEWGCYYAHCDNHLSSRSKLDRNTVILSRKEYLGHTVTAKSYKVSYKSKKTRRNSEEKQYFFPNTHEALIDEETFDLAQKRIATKHRPTKCDEIDLFSGLLFCGDCGYKMYLQQGAGTLERKHAYTCGCYRNRIRTGEVCTTHSPDRRRCEKLCRISKKLGQIAYHTKMVTLSYPSKIRAAPSVVRIDRYIRKIPFTGIAREHILLMNDGITVPGKIIVTAQAAIDGGDFFL